MLGFSVLVLSMLTHCFIWLHLLFSICDKSKCQPEKGRHTSNFTATIWEILSLFQIDKGE